MTRTRLLLESLLYHWRTNLAVLLGVVAGTAVIGGALVVGDSVRDSLRQMSLVRLGEIDHALVSHRFFREELANELARQPGFRERFDAVAPVLKLQGGFVHEAGDSRQTSRAGQVNVYGVDERMWKLTNHGDVAPPGENEVIFSRKTAGDLRVKAGDEVTLYVDLPSSIPRESLLGKRDETSESIQLTVKAVLPEELGVARLELNPNQQLPSNGFVSLGTLQQALDLDAQERSRANPEGRPARVNCLFVSANSEADKTGDSAQNAALALTTYLGDALTLADLRLRLVVNEDLGYLSLESEQMILEDVFAEAAMRPTIPSLQERQPVLVSLANQITNIAKPQAFSRYSVVAGADWLQFQAPPFGPVTFVGDTPQELGLGDIIVNDWLAADLEAGVGDEISLTWHVVGSHGELPELEKTFTIRGIVPLANLIVADRGLTPEVKGITDVNTFADWDAPFPMKPVTSRDDAYWELHRATPKAFVSLETAQELWTSRYGRLTSVRLSAIPETSLDESRSKFTDRFLRSLDLSRLNLAFEPVKHRGVQAASGTTDFSSLFFGFSFFLILSATILIGLLFRLGIERRGTNIGLLSAVGFSPYDVKRLFLAEGLIVVCTGGLIGLAAAVAYATLMVYGLTTWWIGAIQTRFLFVSIHPSSLAAGFAVSVIVAFGAVWWALRMMRSISTRELLSGVTEQSLTEEAQKRRGHQSVKTGLASAGIAALLLLLAILGLVPGSEAFFGLSWQVLAFFISGTSALAASLAFLSAWLDSDRSIAVRGAGAAGMGRLGMRNAARHRQRSVLSTGLIASATFVIVAVAAGHRNPAQETPELNSGNGAFLLVAESSKGILFDMNTPEGRNKLDLDVNARPEDVALFEKMLVMPFRVKPGENASCLNIYQTQLPTLLGAPKRMIERGGFKFIGAGRDNPWKLLNENVKDGEIPVLGDMNSLMYSLHKKVGDMIDVPDKQLEGTDINYKLKIAGMFDGSVFQGVLVMSEENLLKLHPDREGYQYFLIGDRRLEDPSKALTSGEVQRLSELLESGLIDYGFDAEPVVDRLANFLAVQNTYLSTFQTLGGLGLLLGTLGLATVMLRNVLERRPELALLRAVGFRNGNLALLVLLENAFLLIWGLAAGTISALLAMTPHLLSIGADVPWTSAGAILAGVFVVGMLAAFLAVRAAVSTPILASLRSE